MPDRARRRCAPRRRHRSLPAPRCCQALPLRRGVPRGVRRQRRSRRDVGGGKRPRRQPLPRTAILRGRAPRALLRARSRRRPRPRPPARRTHRRRRRRLGGREVLALPRRHRATISGRELRAGAALRRGPAPARPPSGPRPGGRAGPAAQERRVAAGDAGHGGSRGAEPPRAPERTRERRDPGLPRPARGADHAQRRERGARPGRGHRAARAGDSSRTARPRQRPRRLPHPPRRPARPRRGACARLLHPAPALGRGRAQGGDQPGTAPRRGLRVGGAGGRACGRCDRGRGWTSGATVRACRAVGGARSRAQADNRRGPGPHRRRGRSARPPCRRRHRPARPGGTRGGTRDLPAAGHGRGDARPPHRRGAWQRGAGDARGARGAHRRASWSRAKRGE